MIKYIVLFGVLACLARSQRPAYAGSSNRYPVVLPQYLETVVPNVGNRIDGENGSVSGASATRPAAASAPASSAATTTAIPLDLPVDANGDIELVNRIKTWPRDKQPFWFINWQQIQAHRGNSNTLGQATQPPQTNSRSFFAG